MAQAWSACGMHMRSRRARPPAPPTEPSRLTLAAAASRMSPAIITLWSNAMSRAIRFARIKFGATHEGRSVRRCQRHRPCTRHGGPRLAPMGRPSRSKRRTPAKRAQASRRMFEDPLFRQTMALGRGYRCCVGVGEFVH
eukprot:scaffold57706_cov82-Phaeocystis_antarctica.AAC.5